MKKLIFKYLMIVVLLLTVIIYLVSARNELENKVLTKISNNIFKEDGSQLTEAKDELHISEKIEIGKKYPLQYMYKVEDEKANLFSLSYKENKLEVGNVVKATNLPSDQLYLIFRETYPNISLEKMGVNTEEEAYQVVQLAIWEIAGRTGEANEYTELSRIDSIKEEIGLKDANPLVFQKAKELVSFVEEYSKTHDEEIKLVPTLHIINDNIKPKEINENYILGPYSYEMQAGILKKMNITITDEKNKDIKGEIVDSNGDKIEDYTKQKTFYVKVPKEKYNQIKITMQAESMRITPKIYIYDNSDYIANTYVNVTFEKDLYIDFEII